MLDERWSEDTEEIAEALVKLLSAESTPEVVRRAEASPDGRDPATETALAEFGLVELEGRPELFARIAYELGRFITPTALVECMPALAVLKRSSVSFGLTGFVPASVKKVAVCTREAVYIEDVRGEPKRTSAGDFIVDQREAPSGQPVGDIVSADQLTRFSALTGAARLVGGSRGLLEYGLAYARERSQFGKPIGSYQGVAHRLANAATAVDAAELLLRKAAYIASSEAGGDGAPSKLFALMVSAKAVEAARFVATTIHQTFGGYGFSMEYDVQLYSRRLRSWANREPRVSSSLAELGRAVLNPEQRADIRHLWHYDVDIPLPRWAREKDAIA